MPGAAETDRCIDWTALAGRPRAVAAGMRDRIRLVADVLRCRGENRRFRLEHPDFPVPPYRLAFDAYATVSREAYRRSGKELAELMAEIIRRHAARGGLRVLDWGCGAVRVVRHLSASLPARDLELFGSDYNLRTIDWCRRSLPEVKTTRNGLRPPLDFPSSFFDVIYGISVFTHLRAEAQLRWRDELLRCLAPGGILILTMHGSRCRKFLSESGRASFDEGRLVTIERGPEGTKLFASFQPERFVREVLFSAVEVVCHDTRDRLGWFAQDIWVVRRARFTGPNAIPR